MIDNGTSENLNLKRLVGPSVQENTIGKLVMDCIDNSYDATHAKSYENWAGHVAMLKEEELHPEVLLHDLRINMEYSHELENTVKVAQLLG